jgi:hypothetical protein
MRTVWYQHIKAGSYYGYTQSFAVSYNGHGYGEYQLTNNSTWASSSSSDRIIEKVTEWKNIPVGATTTSVSWFCDWWDNNGKSGTAGSSGIRIAIPTY